jgi:hypothetical protein
MIMIIFIRLVPFAVVEFGAFGGQAMALLTDLA